MMNDVEENEEYSIGEFKRDMKRMLDSIRKEGTSATWWNICEGAKCFVCPLDIICENNSNFLRSFEAIEIVHKWAKEHPIITNRDKLKEVFGFEVKRGQRLAVVKSDGLLPVPGRKPGTFREVNRIREDLTEWLDKEWKDLKMVKGDDERCQKEEEAEEGQGR